MMKIAFAWGLLVALAVAGSCSVNHKSGDYACTTQKDCASPRVCTDGFCIVPDGVPIDAPMTEPKDGTVVLVDAPVVTHDSNTTPVCPSACTECDLAAHICKIDCGQGNCGGAVQCPPGYDCTINCSEPNSCRNGVTCSGDSACTILCDGSGTCRNVVCGNGPCDIECTGQGSCRGVTCGNSCACDVSCGDLATCQQITCTNGPLCGDFNGGCSSQGANCDTCQN